VAGRDQNRLHRPAGRHRRRVFARITLLLHLRDHHAADRRRIRHRRAGNRAEERRGDNVHQRQPTADKADEHVGEIHQPSGNAPFRHDRPGKNEERDCQQGKFIDPAGDLDHQRLQRQVNPQRARHGA